MESLYGVCWPRWLGVMSRVCVVAVLGCSVRCQMPASASAAAAAALCQPRERTQPQALSTGSTFQTVRTLIVGPALMRVSALCILLSRRVSGI